MKIVKILLSFSVSVVNVSINLSYYLVAMLVLKEENINIKLITTLIDWFKTLAPPLSQSKVKPKPIVTRLRTFSRAS